MPSTHFVWGVHEERERERENLNTRASCSLQEQEIQEPCRLQIFNMIPTLQQVELETPTAENRHCASGEF